MNKITSQTRINNVHIKSMQRSKHSGLFGRSDRVALLDMTECDNEHFDLSTEKYDVQSEMLRSFLAQINENVPQRENEEEIEEIDVVVSGGGMKGFFTVGCWSVLKGMIENKSIIVRRWAGTSVGAGCVAYMCCGLDPVEWSRTYWKTRRMIRAEGITIVESFRVLSHEVLPSNAHILCSGKVFLSITLLTMFGPKNVIISKFYSKADLIEAIVSSCSIPFMTSPAGVSYFRGMRVIDGGFTNNTPTFHDSPRRQLIMNTPRVHYPSGLVLNMKDPCVDSLVLRGAFLMRQFIAGQYKPKTEPIIEWRDVELQEKQIVLNWRKSLQRGVDFFSATSLLQFSGIPASELLTYGKKKEEMGDESTMRRVSNELKQTLLHYRMAIIILLLSTILMATPAKWEDSGSWKRFLSRLAIWRMRSSRKPSSNQVCIS